MDRLRINLMEMSTPTPMVYAANPYIINLRQIGKTAFFLLLAGILLFLILKIILDFRRFHYKD